MRTGKKLATDRSVVTVRHDDGSERVIDIDAAEEGRALLAEANRPEVTVEKTMLEAAATAVRLAGEAG